MINFDIFHQANNYIRQNKDTVFRTITLFLIAWIITLLINWQIRESSSLYYYVQDVNYEKDEYTLIQIGTLKNVEDMSSFINMPLSVLSFNFYLQNFRKEKIIETGEISNTMISIEMDGVYTHEIKFGETKKIAKNVRGSKISTLPFSISSKSEINVGSTTPILNSFYRTYINPTLLSFVVIYLIVGVPVSHAFLILINSIKSSLLGGYKR